MGKILTYLGEKITATLSAGIIELTPIFVVVAMIGVFISMAGYRKVGTRTTSISFLIYILLRAVIGC